MTDCCPQCRLHAHYEYHPDGLVQRDEIKDAFAAYCASLGQRPRQAAALGKIIKVRGSV